MESCQKVYSVLEAMKIPYRVVEHQPVYTAEEADRCVEGEDGAKIKCLFLCDRKSTRFYLIAMAASDHLDMKSFCRITGERSMKFCSGERLMKKLGLEPGMVSVFGLLNDETKEVSVYLDQSILSEKNVMFHPNDNTKTVIISTEDLYRFLIGIGYNYTVFYDNGSVDSSKI